MEDKKPKDHTVFFNNTLLFIDVRCRLNPHSKTGIKATTSEQGEWVAKCMRRAFIQLHLRVHLDFTNVSPITPQFLKGALGELVKSARGNEILNTMKLGGCSEMTKGMVASIITHERGEYIKSRLLPNQIR